MRSPSSRSRKYMTSASAARKKTLMSMNLRGYVRRFISPMAGRRRALCRRAFRTSVPWGSFMSRLRDQPLDRGQENLLVDDGLGAIVVEAGPEEPLPVAVHRVGGEGDDGKLLELHVGAEVGEHLQ